MSKFDKLKARIKAMDKNLRFEEVKKVLESVGYTMKSPASGSSHSTFRKVGEYPITIPRHNPIEPVYVAMVKDVIE